MEQPEYNLVIDSQEIRQRPRRLRAVWSREVQEDLRSVHNIQASKALTDMLAAEINAEIDAEILNDLRNCASTPPAQGWNTWLPVPAAAEPAKKAKKRYRNIDDPWEES